MQCTPMRAQLPFPSILRPPPVPPLPSPLSLAPWSPIFFSTLFFPPSRASASPTPSFTTFSPRLPPSVLFSPQPFFLLLLLLSLSLSRSVYSCVCTLHSPFSITFLPRPTTAFISFSESIDLCRNARPLSLSVSLSLCVSLTLYFHSPTNADWKPLLRVSRHNTRVVSSSSRHFPRLSSSPSMDGQGARD